MTSGIDVMKRRIGSIKQAIHDKEPWKAAATEWAEEIVVPYAKGIAPVDTGEFRDSIESEVTDDQVRIFSDAEHAIWIEDGTTKAHAQPTIRPAVAKNRPKLSALVRKRYRERLQQ
uniref:Phage protein, HK97 gp10 family n=1 Tax=Caulobacter sp. (strain K31) TaxID=366602 RepID=B0T636_CAUSK